MAGVPAIHGIIAYPITPFGRDGGVDTATLTMLLEKLIGAGVHAIARSVAPAKPRTSLKTSSTASWTRPSTPLAAEFR
jgi:hypothetical protein